MLDGIAFPSEAWTARGVPACPRRPASARRLPTARGAAARLFAFGYDAWLLTAYLEHLARRCRRRSAGATGTLRIDGLGNVAAHAGVVDIQRRQRGAAGGWRSLSRRSIGARAAPRSKPPRAPT